MIEENNECITEHVRFRMNHLVGDRIYDNKQNDESVWVRKNWYDCSGFDDDTICSVIIDNKYEKKYYHTTFRNIDNNRWVHILEES